MTERPRYLSLGAGVQSSTLALMIAKGEIPMVQAAIFADVGDEPRDVYRWLEFLEKQLPYPVIRVSNSAGKLSDASTTLRLSKKSGNTYVVPAVPAHILNGNGTKGMQRRQCTRSHKIDPINSAIRRLAAVRRGSKTPQATVLIGISTDEAMRMKPSRQPWIGHEWPLIDLGMSRKDCLTWMERNGYPTPPRSACTFCPYHSDHEWRRLKTEFPLDFADAVAYEKRLQTAYAQSTLLDGTPFLHSSLKPIDQVDFSDIDSRQVDMFNNECEGICGV